MSSNSEESSSSSCSFEGVSRRRFNQVWTALQDLRNVDIDTLPDLLEAQSGKLKVKRSRLKRENSSKQKQRKILRAAIAMSVKSKKNHAVQKLYDFCRKTLGSGIAGPQTVQGVRAILDSIKAIDVGISEEEALQQELGFQSIWKVLAPPISYLHLHECPDFSVGIFCMPTSAVIPLHNHPGMTVVSKLLYGSMHVKAYDWVDPLDEHASGPRLAKLVADKVLSAPCQASILYPSSGGNIHCFTALTPCAVLDVLTPPYSKRDGRHCTYYHQGSSLPDIHHDVIDATYTWLEPCEPPNDFVVKGEVYRGPKLREH